MKNIQLLLSIALLLAGSAFSQNDPLGDKDKFTLENERIEDVITSDKPYLPLPAEEIQTRDSSAMMYNSQEVYVETDFQPAPPNPVSWKTEDKTNPYNNYVKAGLGRYITPLFQLYLHQGIGEEYDYGLNFTHLSAHDDAITYRRFREDYGTFTAGYLTADHKYVGKVNVYNTTYFPYADSILNFGDTLPDTQVDRLEDSLRTGFTQLGVSANMIRNYVPDQQINYNLGLNLELFTGRLDTREFHATLSPTGSYKFNDDLNLDLGSDFTFTSARIDSQGQTRVFMDLGPMLRYIGDAFEVKGGFRFNFYNNNADTASQTAFVPLVEFRYYVVPNEVTAFAGFSGGMTYNRYFDMARTNRFLSNEIVIRPTIELMNIYAGVSGNYTERLDYNAKVSYRRVEDQLIFVAPENGTTFQAVYDSLMTDIGLELEANYDLLKELKVGTRLEYHIFNTSQVEEFFHATPLTLGVYGAYVWQEKLTVAAELNSFSPTPMALDGEGEVIERSTFVDMNLSADYRLGERFSIWAEFNNLFNGNWQRWYNYDERPLDFKAGATFVF
ncbi:MAG: TonB-dependent receptor [Bacteroidota bacterium]